MKKIIFTSYILLLLVMSPVSGNADDKVSVLLDWFINPDHGPIIIAEEKGYFSEYDLDVEIVAPADPSMPPKLVAAGKADLAISYQPQLHLQVSEGLPLLRVGTLVATPLNCLLVLKDGPISTPADLKNKKIGPMKMHGAVFSEHSTYYQNFKKQLHANSLISSPIRLNCV